MAATIPLSLKETPKPLSEEGHKTTNDKTKSPLDIFRVSSPRGLFNNNKVGSSTASSSLSASPNDSANLTAAALVNYGQQLQTTFVLPVTSRRVRDSGALLAMVAFLAVLGYVIWDGMVTKEADINLIVHGHDSYGNICGRDNKRIRFTDKSGQNFTDKPYTKYTLINAQFERFTLDESRLKRGELVYVKEEEFLEMRRTEVRDLRQLRTSRSGVGLPESQEDKQRQLLNRLLLLGNQSALNELKSRLMYQYPPMYGYSPQEKPASEASRLALAGSSTSLPPRANRSSAEVATASTLVARLPVSAPALMPTVATRTITQSGQVHLATAPSSVSGQRLAPRPTVIQTELSSGNNKSNGINLSFAESVVNQVAGNKSRFEYSAGSSSLAETTVGTSAADPDQPDHILLPPTQGSTSSRSAVEFRGHELAGSQLLYLTECVERCPAEEHVELLFYRCLPRTWRLSLFPNAIKVSRTFIDDIITDLSHCYRELIYIFSVAKVLAIALLVMLRFLATAIIWSCLVLVVGLLLSTATYSWTSYYQQMVELNALGPHEASGQLSAERWASADKWLLGSIFLSLAAFASIAVIVFMRRRIFLVTMLFKEAGKAVADMPLLLIQPLLTFVALLTITLVWSIGLICLQSIKTPVIDSNSGFVLYKADALYKAMKWYHVFAFLWVAHFAIACQHYVIGASVSKWYFVTPNRRYQELSSPIGSSVSELILYYLGSVALGSFLVAVFKVVRLVVRQIQYLVQRNCIGASHATTSGQNDHGPMSIPSPNCCGSFTYVWRTLLWFFDNIVMIISRDAYVEMAIHGRSFLGSAKQAFDILASNPLRLLAIKSVSSLLLLVAKICVVFGTVSVGLVLLEEKQHQLNYSWSPVVVAAIYSYVVAHWFLSVYEMVIDALFICYCEDHERTKKQQAAGLPTLSGPALMTQILNADPRALY